MGGWWRGPTVGQSSRCHVLGSCRVKPFAMAGRCGCICEALDLAAMQAAFRSLIILFVFFSIVHSSHRPTHTRQARLPSHSPQSCLLLLLPSCSAYPCDRSTYVACQPHITRHYLFYPGSSLEIKYGRPTSLPPSPAHAHHPCRPRPTQSRPPVAGLLASMPGQTPANLRQPRYQPMAHPSPLPSEPAHSTPLAGSRVMICALPNHEWWS